MRRGFVTLELLVAVGLFALAMALLVQLLAVSARQQRQFEQRAVALEEAANLLERASALNWQELPPGELKDWKLSPAVERLLPKADARVLVAEEPGPPAGRKLTAEIRWQAEPGRPEPSVALVSWIYPSGGARP